MIKIKQGRPEAYKSEYDELAYNFCLLGASDKDLARFFEVSEQTINAWKKSHPSFLESLKNGKEKADAKIAKALYHRGKGYSHPEEKVFISDGKIIKTNTIKHYPPDTAAAFIWLKNRNPGRWRDKSDTHIDNSVHYHQHVDVKTLQKKEDTGLVDIILKRRKSVGNTKKPA